MRETLRYFILISGLAISTTVYSQAVTGSPILKKVYDNIQRARDYSVEADIRIDIPFIKALPGKAQLFFKQKDKFKVESKGISIIPRQGFNQLGRILHDSAQYICMEQGFEKKDSILAALVNIISVSDTSDLILGKLWIDTKRSVVICSQLTTRSNGTILIEYKYGSQVKYALPDLLVFTVDVKKFKIPKVLGADINNSGQETNTPKKNPKKGKVYITLKNYQINKGIPDSFFNSKK